MRSKLAGAAAVIAAAAGVAFADDPKFEYGKKEEIKDASGVEWHATAEAGALFTTGNSENTNVTGGVKASRKQGDDKVSLEASAAYAKSTVYAFNDLNGNGMVDNSSELTTSDQLTAETLFGKLRYDRFLTDTDSLYVAAVGSRDVPAGKLAVYGGQTGYSRQLYKSATAETVGEIGYDYSHVHLVKGDALDIHSARAFVGHHGTLTAGTVLDASIEVLTNLNHLTLPTGQDGSAFMDTRVNAKVAISAKIGANLAIQTSFEARYDNRPAPLAIKNVMFAPGYTPAAQPLDTILKAQLIYTFAGAEEKKK